MDLRKKIFVKFLIVTFTRDIFKSEHKKVETKKSKVVSRKS